MKVLSLFDGISCGRLALHRARIKVKEYYASEINPYAIKIAQKNFPDTIQVGSVEDLTGTKIGWIDLLIGGSPCQSLSISGDGSGLDGKSKLFWEYVRLLKELRKINPDIKFLLENVPMKDEWEAIITEQLGVVPFRINSYLVSGQHRNRLYWTNILDWDFEPPVDLLIDITDVLLPKTDLPRYLWLSEAEKGYMDRVAKGGRRKWDFGYHSDTAKGKSACLVANLYKGVPNNVLIDRRGGIDIRKFHPIECERLQTLPDNYTDGISNTRRYEAIGNGWTVDVIAHIFTYLNNG